MTSLRLLKFWIETRLSMVGWQSVVAQYYGFLALGRLRGAEDHAAQACATGHTRRIIQAGSCFCRYERLSMNPILLFAAASLLALLACAKADPVVAVVDTTETFRAKPAVDGSRIAWDYSTLRKIAPLPGNAGGYNGYARLIQCFDKSLFCVYESAGNIEAVTSTDGGQSWGGRVRIAASEPGIAMTVPEILELADHSLLVSYNPRPMASNTANQFGIRTIKSYDGGLTWKDARLVYEAGNTFGNGCWEPAAIQLPSGEIHLYFSNEGIYTASDEQNISLVRSIDGGMTWTTTPEIVSFRTGRRDGMPVPILLKGKNEIAFSIEDNFQTTFKPYIIRNALSDNWKSGPVAGNSPNRNYALSEVIADPMYVGAPYLRQLPGGETILSCQSTEGRVSNDIGVSRMMVYVGNDAAQNFSRGSEPFAIKADKSGLWNALSVLSDNTVIALTTTNSYADSSTEVWMIKGYVIPDQTASTRAVTVDGDLNNDGWPATLPVFVGAKGPAQLRGSFAYTDDFLFVGATVNDKTVVANSPSPLDDDGIWVALDATNKSAEALTRTIYDIHAASDGRLLVREGSKGSWVAYDGSTDGIRKVTKKRADGYDVEVAIPWKLLGGKPASGVRIGYNIGLVNNNMSGTYSEGISGNRDIAPYTWSRLVLK